MCFYFPSFLGLPCCVIRLKLNPCIVRTTKSVVLILVPLCNCNPSLWHHLAAAIDCFDSVHVFERFVNALRSLCERMWKVSCSAEEKRTQRIEALRDAMGAGAFSEMVSRQLWTRRTRGSSPSGGQDWAQTLQWWHSDEGMMYWNPLPQPHPQHVSDVLRRGLGRGLPGCFPVPVEKTLEVPKSVVPYLALRITDWLQERQEERFPGLKSRCFMSGRVNFNREGWWESAECSHLLQTTYGWQPRFVARLSFSMALHLRWFKLATRHNLTIGIQTMAPKWMLGGSPQLVGYKLWTELIHTNPTYIHRPTSTYIYLHLLTFTVNWGTVSYNMF